MVASTLAEHRTVKRFRAEEANRPAPPSVLDGPWLRSLAREAGADDVGFVSIDRPELDDEREAIRSVFPRARALLSFVCRLNREPIRSPARSISNLEFHHVGDRVNEVARHLVAALEANGVPALNPSMGFPMEMDRFPGKLWVVSHKKVAVAAGLGQMGIHRNVIHPRFGSFILLGTVLVGAEISEDHQPVEYNPCVECKLCVAACPVGAIGADGRFDFSSCYTHNYREFMGGFTDWVETVADSRNAKDYRRRVSGAESASLWQSLSFGANYKSAYCVSVCPAGDDVIAPFLQDRAGFLDDVVKPLQEKEETIYVVAGSDAERHVAKRFPRKKTKRVGNGLRPATIRAVLAGLPFTFQRNQAEGLNATYHFTFTGEEQVTATVVIHDKTIEVRDGHHGTADLRVTADSRTWLRFLARETSIVWALLRRKVRMRGSPRLLQAFGRCFPS
jgi:Fe-S-cluster-containing hydrogenase component 2